ncbi:hypothetical protein G9A89_017842 [Geosiphon pyriformis]|nr:hypothetical protein G9A89_017842 [Geosiphon pyriformis]
MTQSPIFAIGSVIEDALEKNHELWLVLQNMRKAYNSVGLVRIKMCSRFIRFFGSIYSSRINRVMMDFGLTDGYKVHDGLDQGEVFLSLFWCIFYDSLLCEVKRQADECGYRVNSHFISRCGRTESRAGVSSFFAVGAFHILNIASEFFDINNILINNDKTVAILINCDGMAFSLLISKSPISVAKKGELHHYLGIYLSTEGLSKPSLAKAHSDVRFFSNLVLKKAVSDKQFSYLVAAVLFLIVGYRTQFSYIPISDLRSKSGLPHDFSNDVIHHLSLYGLKTFEQVQAESKLALVVFFTNSVEILRCLFSHQLYDLQVLCWHPLDPLQYPVHVKVNPLNNFLADVVHIFSGCDLSLGGSLVSTFCWRGGTPMFFVLGESYYVKNVSLLRHYGIAFWKWLDPRGLVPAWFELSICFLEGVSSLLVCSMLLAGCDSSDILQSREFGVIGASLFNFNVGHISTYTDRSLSDLGTVDMKAGAAVFFEDIDMDLGVEVSGLMSSILMELMAIALALKCIPSSHSVNLFSDSQTALNACKLKMELVCLDFRNRCWIERHHIVNIIHHKNLRVNWYKVKKHSEVSGNEQADKLARTAALSGWHLPHSVNKHYLRGGGAAISSNSKHFVQDVFQFVHCAHWEVSCGIGVVADNLRTDIDWFRLSLVWHPDFHMATGFTSKWTAGLRTYFIKALHHRLPVTMRKQLYDKCYPSVVYLFCGDVEVSDHAFSCLFDANGCARLLDTHVVVWGVCSSLAHFSSGVLQLLFTCVSNILVSTALYKGFVFKNWFHESNIVAFVRKFSLAFWEDIWLVHAKHRAFMEKNGLILCDRSVSVLISGLFLGLSSSMTQLLGVAKAIGVGFGFCKSCLFFSDIEDEVSVHIGA